MSVQLVDCTIRDGGYLLQKNSDLGFVRGVLEGLRKSGIDYAETGFLQNNSLGESIVYKNIAEMMSVVPKRSGRTEYLAFCDNSRYSPDNLENCDENKIKWIRISFAKHEKEEALLFCEKAKRKGYSVQFNPMDAIGYSEKERAGLLRDVNRVKPACFSIVDTFGAMYLNDLDEIYFHCNEVLDKNIKIGLHSHDNLGLSCALAEQLISFATKTERDVLVDGSLLGMGRGAGNAKTELLAEYINRYSGGKYDIACLLDVIDTYIVPLRDKLKWGYDLPMYICGTLHAHVDNVYHLKEKWKCNVGEMYTVLGQMTIDERIRYGVGYKKDDFSALDDYCSSIHSCEENK